MSEVVTALPQSHPSARSRAATRAVWRERLARFPGSGLTAAQFCALEAVSVPSFDAWKRRLATENRAAAAPQDPAQDLGPRLLPVRLQPPSPAVELVLPCGAVLRLPQGA